MGAQGRWREDQEDQAQGNVWFKRCQPSRLPELPPHLDGLHLLRTVLALLLPPPTYPTSSVLGPQSPLLQPHPHLTAQPPAWCSRSRWGTYFQQSLSTARPQRAAHQASGAQCSSPHTLDSPGMAVRLFHTRALPCSGPD